MSLVAAAGGVRTSGAAMDLPALLTIGGADALAFLQGQLTNDLERLDATSVLPAALNTPQGRVVAVLRLFQGEYGIGALLPRSLLKDTTERLRKYILRAKVTLAEASGVSVIPLTGAAAETVARNFAIADAVPGVGRAGPLTLVALGGPVPRALLIGPDAAVGQLLTDSSLTAADDNSWRLAQIQAGEADLYPETAGQFVAQMLNLDLIGAISFTKGCYTGQEIIARTHHLGRVKRRTFRFETPAGAQLQRMQTVATPDGRSAKVLDFAKRDDGAVELLAVVSEASRDETAAPDVVLSPLPLPYEVPA